MKTVLLCALLCSLVAGILDWPSGSGDSNRNVGTCNFPIFSAGLVADYCTGGTTGIAMCQYSCMTGYTMNGTSSVTCGSDGMFSPSIPTCDIVTCDVPPLSPGLVADDCTVGGTTDYSCMTGYTINGMSSVTCRSDGMFSPSIPTCDIVTCYIPPLSPGLVADDCTVGGTTDYNTMCQFTCRTGYTMNGMSSVTCGSHGMFSPSIPTCDSILDWSSGSEDSNRNNRFGILDWSSGSGSNRNNRFVSAAIDCYTCEGTDCGDPFDPTASGMLDACPSVAGGQKKYCWKVVHNGNVSRGCGNFCSEGCVGSTCTYCCGTDRCNGGTAVKTSFVAMGVTLFAVFIFSKE